MIKLQLGFGEFYLIFKDSAETLLDGFSCLIYDAAPLRVVVPSKYYFTAVIIDYFSDEKLRHSYFC